MATVEVKAEERRTGGKGGARRLRVEGKIPGVVYGAGEESIPIAVQAATFEKMLRHVSSGNVILDVKLAGQEGRDLKTLIKEVQRDPRNEHVLHFDLQHISMSQKVRVHVPIALRGTAPGVKEGGILEHLLRELEIECLPTEIPAEIPVDVGHLDKGMAIHVRDLDLGGTHVHDAPDRVVVSVVTKAKEEAAEAAAAAPEGAVPVEAPAPAEGAPKAKEAPSKAKEAPSKAKEGPKREKS